MSSKSKTVIIISVSNIYICKNIRQCLQQYLQNKIFTAEVVAIRCPNGQCENPLSDQFIHSILNDEGLFKKFLRFKQIKELENDINIRWCPRAGCEGFARREEDELVLLKCSCGQPICFECGGEYHLGITCEEAIDETFKIAITQHGIQHCPNCRSPIQKSEGCNHMTCGKCHYEFCWICGQHYTSNHYNQLNVFGCPGLQRQQRPTVNCPMCRVLFNIIQILFKIFILGPLILILGFVGLIMLPLFFPGIIYIRTVSEGRFLRLSLINYSCCHKFCVVLFIWIIGGIVLYPVFVALACLVALIGIIPAILVLIIHIIQWTLRCVCCCL